MTDARKIEAIAKALWCLHFSADIWPDDEPIGAHPVLKADYLRQAQAILSALQELEGKDRE